MIQLSRLLRRRRDEQGVTIVEAAFVFPLLFLFAFALIDLGLWVFQRSQATSAARDGARAGIVLDVATNSNWTGSNPNRAKIESAVKARLQNQNVDNITITCVHAGVEGPCQDVTSADYGTDRIKVVVDWQRPFLTFVGNLLPGVTPTVRGSSTMVIVGRPVSS